MKTKIFLALLILNGWVCYLHAQQTICSTLPLSYNTDSIFFITASPVTFGDSMITFLITNNHPSQGYAYPLAKLEPVTPLPSGMNLSNNNQPWSVFASAWNPGETMPVYIFYNITAPIPADYMVTYRIWVNNLTPTIADSCYFDSTFTINLNPSGLNTIRFLDQSECSISQTLLNNLLRLNGSGH